MTNLGSTPTLLAAAIRHLQTNPSTPRAIDPRQSDSKQDAPAATRSPLRCISTKLQRESHAKRSAPIAARSQFTCMPPELWLNVMEAADDRTFIALTSTHRAARELVTPSMYRRRLQNLPGGWEDAGGDNDDSAIATGGSEAGGNNDDGMLSSRESDGGALEIASVTQRCRSAFVAQAHATQGLGVLKKRFAKASTGKLCDAVETSAFSPDGMTVATGSRQGGVRLWDVKHAKPRDSYSRAQFSGAIKTMQFSPDSARLYVVSKEGDVGAIDRDGALLWRKKLDAPGSIIAARFAPDCRHLATSSTSLLASVWSVGANGALACSAQMRARQVAFTADSRFVILGGSAVNVIDLRHPGHAAQELPNIDFNPHGLAVASDTVAVFGVGSMRARLYKCGAPSAYVGAINHGGATDAALSKTGRYLAMRHGSWVQIWNVENLRQPPVSLERAVYSMRCMAFAPDERALVILGDVGLETWTFADAEKQTYTLKVPGGVSEDIAFSPHARFVVGGKGDGPGVWEV